MTKADIKRIFKAIDEKNHETLFLLLDKHPEEIDVFGIHNQFCRDKTPLMYAIQTYDFDLADKLIARGANVNAKMAGGPCSSVIQLAAGIAHSLHPEFNEYFKFIKKIIDLGANPSDALWAACGGYKKDRDRPEIIEYLLSHGANPDLPVGNSGNTVRELIEINSRLYSSYVLQLFKIEN